ncbi:MAG: hypothetical protein CMA27_03480 [Euryarchaeota archaeon]|nr:hypothetical protein [Euryarchaeota archaeon]
MSVINNSNKEMLYELLSDIVKDNNIGITNPNIITTFIDKQCAFFHTQRLDYSSLNEINKKIIELSYNYLLSLNQNKPQPIKKSNAPTKNNFEEKQQNYNKLLNPIKPKEIDFADGEEDFPIQNLDVIMNQTLADRQKELERITGKYSNNKQAQKWLNREEDTPKIKIEKNSNINLESVNIPYNNVQKKEKKVRFQVNDTNGGLNTLFSKLKKKKEITNDDIMENLKTIISNQEKIISLLVPKDENN